MKKKNKSNNVGLKKFLILIIAFFIIYFVLDGITFIKCPFKMITGCDCPACGLQRMVMALFKGEFKEAFWLNPYLAILFPYFFALVGAEVFKNQVTERIKRVLYHPILIGVLVLLMITWWIFRNTDTWHTIISSM